jgi:hypothetical protein
MWNENESLVHAKGKVFKYLLFLQKIKPMKNSFGIFQGMI